MTQTTDLTNEQTVLIMGGGHVGLSLSLLLAYHHIHSIVVEKNRYPTISVENDRRREQYLDSRNTALSRRTVQIYQEIGLWQRLASHACRIDSVQIYEKDSFGHACLKKEQEGVESFGYVMENAHLGFCLLSAVKDSPFIHLIDGVEVVDIAQSPSHVSISLQDNTVLTGSILVACDGQNSPARKLLGVSASEYDYGQTAVVGMVQTQKPHEHTAIECFSPLGPLALLPMSDGAGGLTDETIPNQSANLSNGCYRSVVWVCKKGDESRCLSDDAYFLAQLQTTFGKQVGEFIKAGKRGAFELVKILADKQIVGRAVIMGNAAHTLHPVAGQGFNLCMRDAYALTKRLAVAKANGQDFGDFSLLSDYEAVRIKDQKRVIFFCDSVVKLFVSPNPIIKWGRNLGLLIFEYVPKVKPMVATFAMGLKSDA